MLTKDEIIELADAFAREQAKDYGVFWQDAYNISIASFKAGVELTLNEIKQALQKDNQ